LEYRRLEGPDLLPAVNRAEAQQLGLDGYKADTFPSDYDKFVDELGTECVTGITCNEDWGSAGST
jgi:hypothetical protein